jgi:hypothetical protein
MSNTPTQVNNHKLMDESHLEKDFDIANK